MHVCILSTVATGALVLKLQAISAYSGDDIYCITPVLYQNIDIHSEQH